MMMGLGFLIMLAILAVPILLIVGLVLLIAKPAFGQPSAGSAVPAAQLATPAKPTVCAHCGARLQPEWNHCPQCGAPT